LNIIDVLVIAPSYVELILTLAKVDIVDDLTTLWQLLLPLRTLRLLKLARYSNGLRKFAAVLHRSKMQLVTAGVTAVIAIMVSSTIVYYAEKDVLTVCDACSG
jgi:uncharacterized membrane protein